MPNELVDFLSKLDVSPARLNNTYSVQAAIVFSTTMAVKDIITHLKSQTPFVGSLYKLSKA